jgi:hypothetical protein
MDQRRIDSRGATRRPACPGCGHVEHRDECRGRKAPSTAVPILDPATGDPIGGFACYRGSRPPCRCPYGWCHTCRVVIVGASTLPLDNGEPEIDLDIDPGFAGGALTAGHELAARTLADGTIAVRRLEVGEDLPEGWHRARAHEHQLAQVGSG